MDGETESSRGGCGGNDWVSDGQRESQALILRGERGAAGGPNSPPSWPSKAPTHHLLAAHCACAAHSAPSGRTPLPASRPPSSLKDMKSALQCLPRNLADPPRAQESLPSSLLRTSPGPPGSSLPWDSSSHKTLRSQWQSPLHSHFRRGTESGGGAGACPVTNAAGES